jgi:hypothetical protein
MYLNDFIFSTLQKEGSEGSSACSKSEISLLLYYHNHNHKTRLGTRNFEDKYKSFEIERSTASMLLKN